MDDEVATSFAAERVRLVHLCAYLTGSPDAAEDLAQEVLLVGWSRASRLRDPARRSQWLSGIARHLCLHWFRRHRRDLAHLARPAPTGESESSTAPRGIQELPDPAGEIDVELERAELAALLDRAMAMLPPDTRQILLLRHVEAYPRAEIARRLAMSEGAVAMRLYRGTLTLRRVLTSTLREEAASLGLVPASDAVGDRQGWHDTPIWCPGCGVRRLQARTSGGGIAFRCSGGKGVLGQSSDTSVFQGLKSFRPMLHRLITHAARWARESLAAGVAPCYGCGRLLPLQRGPAAPLPKACGTAPGATSGATSIIYASCPACGAVCGQGLAGTALGLPEVRRFWRDHPRIRLLPERQVEADGRKVAVVGFESVTGAARLDVLADAERFQVLGVGDG